MKYTKWIYGFVGSFLFFTTPCIHAASSLWGKLTGEFSSASSERAMGAFSSAKKIILAKAKGLSPQVLDLALHAYNKLYQSGYDPQKILTIIDYSKPSTAHRLWVIDLKRFSVILHTLVSHGKNSGAIFPRYFSDAPQSLQSSIGVYLTGETYVGKHGYSLRLQGLEPGFNAQAYQRAVVIHPAFYASETFLKSHGQLGRSWGCPAVSPDVAPRMIERIKGGTVLVAYYPDPAWLRHSTYLNT